MKSMRKRNRILIFVILLLGISIGFAYVNGLLKLNGIANISRQTWDVYFDNIQVTSGSVTASSPATIVSGDPTKVTYSVSLDSVGDFYEFTVDAVNNGSIDAMISYVIFENTVESPSLDGTKTEIPEHINYSITYADGIPLGEGHLLEKKSGNTPTTETYKVRIEYGDINTDVFSYTLTLKFEVLYEQADETAKYRSSFTVGKYFTMVPDASTYDVLAADTGYSTNQTITPNELTLWRVINVNNDGTVEAVSHYVSSNTVTLTSTTGYANYVGALQTISQQYAKTGYTQSTRMFGYDGQTLTIPNHPATCDTEECQTTTTHVFDGSIYSCPFNQSTPSPTTGTGQEYYKGANGDTLYLRDYQLVNSVYSDQATENITPLMASVANTDISCEENYNPKTDQMETTCVGDNYFATSRYDNNALLCDYNGRVIGYSGYLSYFQLRNYWQGAWYDGSATAHIRPIITLNRNVTIASGTGTKTDPYILN